MGVKVIHCRKMGSAVQEIQPKSTSQEMEFGESQFPRHQFETAASESQGEGRYLYSFTQYGEILARRVKTVADSIDGAERVLYRVPETLPMEVLEQLRLAQKGDNVPVISVNQLVGANGLLFGFPTRFWSMAAQLTVFVDSTFPLCEQQRLAGVPAGFFVSTGYGARGGGQDSTSWI